MTYPLGKEFEIKYTYDFSVDGGGTGALTLTPQPNFNGLAEGMIVREISVYTETALTSGGTPTITLGPTADPDGYMADFWSLGNAANSVVRPGEVAGVLLWDDTNDHRLDYRIGSAANTQDLLLTVGTAALTAGVMVITMQVIFPAAAAPPSL
jgi:hypothetical protein